MNALSLQRKTTDSLKHNLRGCLTRPPDLARYQTQRIAIAQRAAYALRVVVGDEMPRSASSLAVNL
jgi:hypothetical protein